MIRRFFIFFIVLVCFGKAYAVDSLKRAPEAVLVQLPSEHNRVVALTAAGRHAAVEEVKADGQAVTAVMINDFTDHFTFCPVYYYIDTNIDLIQQKKFAGVLLNADGSPVKDAVINESSKKYLVVYYGYPTNQVRKEKEAKDPNRYEYDPGEQMGKGLVVLNSNFYQVSFFYKFGFNEILSKKKKDKRYYYQSRHYDMEYFPFASELDKTLYKHHEKMKINHANGSTDDLYDRK